MKPESIIDIPTISNDEIFKMNRKRAESNMNDFCPCCGKEIKNPKYFINSIYGGCAYPKHDKNEYNDAWVMAVGTECRKKFPSEYIMTKEEI